MTEEWRVIPGHYPYEASSLGNVRNTATGQMLSSDPLKGYRRVGVQQADVVGKTKHVHRLVALAFLGEPPADKPVVNHKNGDKLDNRIDNLEYVSYQENSQHYLDEIRPKVTGVKREMAEKTVRRQKNIVIVRKQNRFNISLSHAAARKIEGLQSTAIIDMFLRFSVAQGGPDELFAAWDYWGQIETCGRGSAAIEASIWWNEGAAQAAQKGNE